MRLLAYTRAGDGPRSVVTLDLTGHGASPPLPPRADLAALARAVLDTALAHLTLLDVTPSSWPPGGGTVPIVEALVRAPERARSRDDFRVHFRDAGLAAATVDWLLMNLAHEDGAYGWRVDRAALAALYPAIGADDLWPAVEGRPAYSVHTIRGGASDDVPEADARRLDAAGCRVDTLEGAGHFLHVDRPEELADLVAVGLPA